jgi:hypothetical protein
MTDELKEKVIHTRISESLDDEIRKRATNLGVSVSNLVRNVLLNAFGLVEEIMADGAEIARASGARSRSQSRAGRTRAESDGQDATDAPVLGWQQIVLNRNAVCAQCNGILSKGHEAAVAVRDGEGPRTVICKTCLAEVTNGGSSQ